MGYDESDIYNSQNILSLKLKGYKNGLSSEYNNIFKEIIQNEIIISLESTLKKISNLEANIKVISGNIANLDSKTVSNHKRIMIIDRSIKDLKSNIVKLEGEISEEIALEQQLKEYYSKLNNIELPYSEIISYYYTIIIFVILK